MFGGRIIQTTMNYSRLFVIILLTIPAIARAQSSIAPADSVDIKNQIEGFYAWYVDMGFSINRKLLTEPPATSL